MSSFASPADDPVAELDRLLAAQAANPVRGQAGDFDMNDEADREALAPFPQLHEALDWLGRNVTKPWKVADAAAIVHQHRHSTLARTAIAAGTGAIILAVLQLALKLSWPDLTPVTFWLEVMTAMGGVVSVAVGLWAKADRNWLGQRHLAERLRMLKFRALARPELWSGEVEQWRAWGQRQLEALRGIEQFERVEQWSREDEPEAVSLAPGDHVVDTTTVAALAAYYRRKRLDCQRAYFEQNGADAERHARWQRGLRLPLFLVTIGCVLLHFAADALAGRMEHSGSPDAARFWDLVSLWGVALAAVLPVYSVGVRAWTTAFEHARKARSFAAKHQAMQNAIRRLENDTRDLAAVLGHMQHDELFLEQEHREWLRLLLDAEWFL